VKRSPRRRLNLRKTLFLLPNLITLSAVFCGFESIRRAAASGGDETELFKASLLIVCAMVFDALDGRVARMTKTQSAFGLQIDSLADAISFGVAPGVLVHAWTLHRFGSLGALASFCFTAAAVVRLARFNVLSMGEEGKPTKPSKYFLGLPTPGAAGTLVSMVIANHAVSGPLGSASFAPLALVATIALAVLMVSNVEFRTFKDVRLDTRTIAFVAFTILSSLAIGLELAPAFVLPWLLGCYLLLGLLESAWRLPGRLRDRREARARSLD
jgi:CDP-diacylglycerol--serine O-phosphatidyltransferase